MKFLYENFLQFYLLALTSIIQRFKKICFRTSKKDLLKTDIIFTYELIKIGRKYSRIILNTHLDLEKFNSQNPELEKVPTKKEYKVNKSKLITNTFEKQKSKIIEKTILSDEEVKKIMADFDNH